MPAYFLYDSYSYKEIRRGESGRFARDAIGRRSKGGADPVAGPDSDRRDWRSRGVYAARHRVPESLGVFRRRSPHLPADPRLGGAARGGGKPPGTFSPATYRLYATSLPGWPGRDPYPQPAGIRSGKGGSAQDSGAEGPSGRSSSPGQFRDQSASRAPAGALGSISRWRPLSFAPSLSRTVALKFIAYACLFFLVLFYPFRSYPHSHGERRFCRRVLKVVLVTGLAVGCVGLLEQAFWNG